MDQEQYSNKQAKVNCRKSANLTYSWQSALNPTEVVVSLVFSAILHISQLLAQLDLASGLRHMEVVYTLSSSGRTQQL